MSLFRKMEEIIEVDNIRAINRPPEGGLFFRVHWKGYGSDEDTWEPETNLIDCRQELYDFFKNVPNALKIYNDFQRETAISEGKRPPKPKNAKSFLKKTKKKVSSSDDDETFNETPINTQPKPVQTKQTKKETRNSRKEPKKLQIKKPPVNKNSSKKQEKTEECFSPIPTTSQETTSAQLIKSIFEKSSDTDSDDSQKSPIFNEPAPKEKEKEIAAPKKEVSKKTSATNDYDDNNEDEQFRSHSRFKSDSSGTDSDDQIEKEAPPPVKQAPTVQILKNDNSIIKIEVPANFSEKKGNEEAIIDKTVQSQVFPPGKTGINVIRVLSVDKVDSSVDDKSLLDRFVVTFVQPDDAEEKVYGMSVSRYICPDEIIDYLFNKVTSPE